MKKKRVSEFSDTAVIILLVAVILVSFIGTLLVYNTMNNVKLNRENPQITLNRDNTKLVGASGMVTVNIIDREYENLDIGGNPS